MHPEHFFAGGIGKPLQLAQGFGQHGGIECRIDDGMPPGILNDERRSQPVVAGPTTALPVDSLSNTAWVFAVDNFFQTREDVGVTAFAKFDHDPAPAHLVRYRTSSAGTSEGVQNPILGFSTTLN